MTDVRSYCPPDASTRRESNGRASRGCPRTVRKSESAQSGRSTLVNGPRSAGEKISAREKLKSGPRFLSSQDNSFRTFYNNRKTHWGATASTCENIFVDDENMPYPADELGEEMASNARVWRVYMDEATQFDSDMIDGWNRSLDVLLVFAGLFSGVVTTFAIQSSQNSQPNFAQISVLLQQQMLAIMQGTPAESTSAPSWTSSQTTGQTQWISALWFTSLACSLSSAFVSMLVKQWLQEYQSDMSGTPQDRARLRQYRYMGLNAWQVPAIVNVLPVLLHTSLFFFFVGLVLFLWSLDQTTAAPVLIIGLAAFLGYLATTLLPIVFSQCPYVTPVSIGLLKLFAKATIMGRVIILRISNFNLVVKSLLFHSVSGRHGSKHYVREYATLDCEPLLPILNPRKAAELQSISLSSGLVDGKAITWLFSVSTDRAVMETALRAIAGFSRGSAAVEAVHEGGAFPLVDRYLRACFPSQERREAYSPQELSRAGCYARAWMHLAHHSDPETSWQSGASVGRIFSQLADAQDPDVSIIGSCAVMQFYGSGQSTVKQGLDFLKHSIDGNIQLKPYTLSLLLDTIAWAAIKWAIPSSRPHEVGAVPIFVRLIHSLRPAPSSDLARMISIAFFPFAEPRCGLDGKPFDITTAGSMPDSRELLVRELMRVTGDPIWYGLDDKCVLSLAVEEVTRLLLDGLHDPSTMERPVIPSYIIESTALLASRFIVGRLCPAPSADRIFPDVFQLFLQCPYDVPLADARFISTLAHVLSTSQDHCVIRRAILLIKRCIAESSATVLCAFVERDGLTSLFKHVTPLSTNRDLAAALLCAFFVDVILMYRRKALHVGCLLNAIFRSTAIDTACLGAGEDRWTLFETHSWLSLFLELCHFRPSDPAWTNVISSFSLSVNHLLEQGQDITDESLVDVRRIVQLQVRELRRLACLEGGEFDYRRAISLVPLFAPIDAETSSDYELDLARMRSFKPYRILESIV